MTQTQSGDRPVTAASLTDEQWATVEHYKAFGVPAAWLYGEPNEAGKIEVVALGIDFIWSLWIDADGKCGASEATVSEFSTGIEV